VEVSSVKTIGASVIAVAAFFISTGIAVGHHSFAAEYDNNKPVTVNGVVKSLDWVNPHAYVFVDAKDESGKPVTWAFECLSPNALARQGWNRNSLKPGDRVVVNGYLAKDGKPLADGSIHANSRLISLADGRKVFQGSSSDDGGPSK
jgi:tRNA(Ile2) C34 agmatinyltransferase TiaS